MVAQLYWNTVSYEPDNIVDLGSHAELIPLSYTLSITSDNEATFKIQAGKLPGGMALDKYGTIQGQPILTNAAGTVTVGLNGLPVEVPKEEVYVFVVRATDQVTKRIADQTFRITITGEDPPIPYQNTYVYIFPNLASLPDPYLQDTNTLEYIWMNKIVYVSDIGNEAHTGAAYICSPSFDPLIPSAIILTWVPSLTPKNTLGTFNDGTWIDVSIGANDPDPGDVLTYTVVKGSIPNGLTLEKYTGRIYGYVEPSELTINLLYGFSAELYDSRGYDEGETLGNKTYNFTIRVDDGKIPVLQEYQLTIVRMDLQTADVTITSADTVAITADNAAKHLPVLLDREVEIGIYTDDNFFTHEFLGHDFDGDEIGYEIVPNRQSLDPYNLVPDKTWLGSLTGWLYGYLDPIALGQTEFDFDVRVYKKLYEPNPVQYQVDYAINYPFNYINGRTQAEMDSLYIDITGTNFDGKLFLFRQQENFDAAAFPNSQPAQDDGWQDEFNGPIGIHSLNAIGSDYAINDTGFVVGGTTTAEYLITNVDGNGGVLSYTLTNLGDGYSVSTSVATTVGGGQPGVGHGFTISISTVSAGTIPGWNEHQFAPSSVPNKRGGIWRAVKIQNHPSPNYYKFEFVNQVELNQVVRSTRHIVTNPSAIVIPGTGDPSPTVLFLLPVAYAVVPAGVPEYTIENTRNPFETRWAKKLVIKNSNNFAIKWVTENIAPMIAGKPCKVQFLAVNEAGTTITYKVTSGKFPQGLQLNSNGMLEGRPSLQHFNFVDGTTLDEGYTTFDKIHTFTIEASTTVNDPIQRTIAAERTFSTYVEYPTSKPTNNLYLEFLLPQESRDLLLNKLFDDSVVPVESVYRYDDYYFGIQSDFKMLIGYGLNPTDDAHLARAIAAYHHTKKYLFRDLKLAQSLDADGNVEYEVIYIEPRDEFTTDSASWLGKVYLNGKFSPTKTTDEELLQEVNTELINVSQDRILEAYPASEPNMQERLKEKLLDFSLRYLPNWMLSRQTNGRITYWVPAIPIVYVKPGLGKQVLYKLSQASIPLNSINAMTDRYYWDNGEAINWDLDNNKFYPNIETTFDHLITTGDFEITDYVDYAVDVPFYRINANVRRNLEIEGVLDSCRNIQVGMTLIFTKQELFGTNIEYADIDGWGDSLFLNDSGDYEQGPLEQYDVVPGYLEKTNDMSGQTLNKRGGIWRVNEVNGVIKLEFVKEINLPGSSYSVIGNNAYPATLTAGDNFIINASTITLTGTTVSSVATDINNAAIPGITATTSNGKLVIVSTTNMTIENATPQVGNALVDLGIDSNTYYLPIPQAVYVRRGVTYGGSVQVFVPAGAVGPDATVPGYVDQAEVNPNTGTMFDNDSMRFIDANLDVYLEEDTGAKYIVFEDKYYLDYGVVDV